MIFSAVKKPRASAKMNMCEGPILPLLIKFAFPLLITGVLQVLFNAADMIIVGQFSANKELCVAAVGSTGSLVALIVNTFIGLSVGTNVLCARFFGAKEHEDLSKTVHTSIVLSLIIGAFLTVVGFFGAEFFLTLMSTPSEVLPLATLYLRIYFLGMVPMLIYNFSAAILRAVGDTKRPMYFLTAAGIVNVIFNVIFVLGFHLDVAGVAIATVISQVISSTLTLRCLIKDDGDIKLCLAQLKLDKGKLIQIVRIGVPAGIHSAMFSISNVIMQSSINIYDIVTTGGTGLIVAGCSAAGNIEGLSFTALDSVYQAVVSFTGQNFGTRNYERIKKAQKYGQILVLALGITLCALMCIFAEPLVSLYAGDESAQVIEIGANRLRLVGGTAFIFGCSNILVGTIRGLGYSVIPTITSAICICGFRILWVYTVFQVWFDIYVLYACFPISYMLCLIVQAICLVYVMKDAQRRYPPKDKLLA